MAPPARPEPSFSVDLLTDGGRLALRQLIELGAYECLVKEISSGLLKSAYRRLAKKFHPDVTANGNGDSIACGHGPSQGDSRAGNHAFIQLRANYDTVARELKALAATTS